MGGGRTWRFDCMSDFVLGSTTCIHIVPKFMLTVSYDGNPIMYQYREIKYTENFAIRNVAAIYAHKPVCTAELEKKYFPVS